MITQSARLPALAASIHSYSERTPSCAEGYGFKIPADPAKKGIVEAGVKYVKRNFLPTPTFRDLPDLNAQARQWVMNEAGMRINGTTRERPLERFERERPLKQPLPQIAPDLGVWTQVSVHRDLMATSDRRRGRPRRTGAVAPIGGINVGVVIFTGNSGVALACR